MSEHIELRKAVLCVNCECISDSRGSCCCCGSHSLFNVAALMSGKREEKPVSVYEVERTLFRLETLK